MQIGLPLSIMDARRIVSQLRDHYGVHYNSQTDNSQTKLGACLHGWYIEYRQNVDGRLEDYKSRYLHREAQAVFKDGTLTFYGTQERATAWKDVVYRWGQLASDFSSLEIQKGYVHTADGTIYLTGGMLEYLWQEGYQFEDYLPGRFKSDSYAECKGAAVLHYMKEKGNEEAVLDQLRTWYLARLAEHNLLEVAEADEVLRRRCRQHKPDSEFAKFLGTFCRNVMDNLLLLEPKVEKVALEWSDNDEVEKVALEWTPLLTGVE